MSFFDKFSDLIRFVAEKVDDNKYLSAVKTTFSIYMAFVVTGSLASLLNTWVSSESTGLARFSGLEFLSQIGPAFTAVNFATISSMTIPIVFILGSTLGKANKQNSTISGILSLSVYLSIVPQSITTVFEDVSNISSGLPENSINSSGLFIGIFLTFLVVESFTRLSNIDKLKIKMPESVPHAISRSFNALIPTIITLFVFSILGRIFYIYTDLYLNEFIYSVVQTPMQNLFQSTGGIIISTIIMQLFWLVGIHGGLIISPIRNPILIAALAENIANQEAGLVATNEITMTFWRLFVSIGGAGSIIGLIFAIFIGSKRKEYKALAKLSFIPSFFGISEPIVFGLPLVLNPIFAIPFVFGSAVTTGVALLAMRIGFISPTIIDVPGFLPTIFNGFLGYGINGAITQIVGIIVVTLFYLPFVMISNRQMDENG